MQSCAVAVVARAVVGDAARRREVGEAEVAVIEERRRERERPGQRDLDALARLDARLQAVGEAPELEPRHRHEERGRLVRDAERRHERDRLREAQAREQSRIDRRNRAVRAAAAARVRDSAPSVRHRLEHVDANAGRDLPARRRPG